MSILREERDDSNASASRVLESLRDVNEQLLLKVVETQQRLEMAERARLQMEHIADLDALTGLPRCTLIRDRFTQAAAIARRHRRPLGVLFFDLDEFKHVNDELGRTGGDAVLRLVAQRLSASIRTADIACRQGGVEFVVMLTDLVAAGDAAAIAIKLCNALAHPMHVGDRAVHLSASCGISIFPDDGVESDELIDHAEAAMYEARRRGLGRFAFYGDRASAIAAPLRGDESPETARDRVHDDRHATLRDANEHLVLATLTAQDLQADAEQAQRRQSEFMAILAHELRTPLAPMRNVSALLEHLTADDPMLPRLKAIIERQVDHMALLVDDLLDVSRAITGKLHMRLEMVNLAAVVQEAVQASRAGIETRHQIFALELPSYDVQVLGDSRRLLQVISNLLDNASKYTPSGGAISLTMVADDRAVTLTVVDSGIGITAAALTGVFGLFAQDVHAVGYNGIGLGIGLTVVHELVQAHGGTVTAHSLGATQGSQFVVTLPLVPTVNTDQPIA